MVKRLVKNIYLALRLILLRCFIRRKPISRIDPAGIESILIIRVDRLGDMIVSMAAMRALKTILPDAKLAVLASRSNSALLKKLNWIDEVIIYRGLVDSTKVLRERKFSMAIDLLMDYTLKTAWIALLSNARFTVGFDIAGRGRMFNASVKPSEDKKAMSSHLVELVRLIAGLAGIDKAKVVDGAPLIELPGELKTAGREFLSVSGITGQDRVVGIAPGGKFPSQCWKEEGFSRLADDIMDKYRAKVVIIASEEEELKVKRIVSSMKNKPAVILGLPLDELAGVIANLNILVSNNSGPLHLAASLGVATVSTMGPTVPHL
jgi:ADP-heptose:LPS heptosyltransferase